PVAGIGGNRAGQVGQYVKPGTQLLSLVPLPRVYITANFKETQLTRIRVGQIAEVFVDAYPDQPLRGRVESFAPASGAQFSRPPPRPKPTRRDELDLGAAVAAGATRPGSGRRAEAPAGAPGPAGASGAILARSGAGAAAARLDRRVGHGVRPVHGDHGCADRY